ncbi:MAG: carbamoyltransferase HypF [Bilifractor sp.]|jgi:hydrogenase maturation protein HypF
MSNMKFESPGERSFCGKNNGTADENRIRRVRIRLYGIVQGIGFRPFVSRLADRCRIAGDVCNKGSYVEIHAEAESRRIEEFRRRLVDDAPAVSAIIRVEVREEEPEELCPGAGDRSACEPETSGTVRRFRIIRSKSEAGDIFVSPDLATCPNCRAELFDPGNRRYLHPFINCTDCGPRLTILDSMPYDRVRTSMGEFPMCEKCEYEYTHPETRRYHAQPVCCPDDGPQLFIPGRPEIKGDALVYTREVIRQGGIAAIKGIGGFHLCCDARNEEAVRRLRRLKTRPMKPFAVMMRDMDTVRRECVLLPGQEKVMTGVQKPILILERRRDGTLPDVLAPGNPNLGVMLPYAPVQMLLFDYPDGKPMTDVFVMTSGNVRGAPICRTTADAQRWLSPMCDVILSNDRKIRLRADDSVMQFAEGRPYMIRRSRGYAPLPFKGPEGWKGEILAVGGELKNTFLLAKNEWYYPSPYIGDLADLRSVEALKSAVHRMETLLEIRPEAVVCDLHPMYNSVAFAREYSESGGSGNKAEKGCGPLPLLYVQHHYAHILSCMAENETEDPVIGVSFDGTGYGTDGTIWGGEFLIADPYSFTRAGSIAPFLQAGGDVSAREGWRIAVSMIRKAYGAGPESRDIELIRQLSLCDEKNRKIQYTMLERGINAVESTSAGRLFDAVSAILGIRRESTFEGEASMALEFAAEAWEKEEKNPKVTLPEIPVLTYSGKGRPLPKKTGGDTGKERSFLLDTDALIRAMADGRVSGEKAGKLAFSFHVLLAGMIREGTRRCRDITGISRAALSGGVFQNLLLLRLTKELLEEDGFEVLTHSLIPPNDGGIGLGQGYYAMARLNRNRE